MYVFTVTGDSFSLSFFVLYCASSLLLSIFYSVSFSDVGACVCLGAFLSLSLFLPWHSLLLWLSKRKGKSSTSVNWKRSRVMCSVNQTPGRIWNCVMKAVSLGMYGVQARADAWLYVHERHHLTSQSVCVDVCFFLAFWSSSYSFSFCFFLRSMTLVAGSLFKLIERLTGLKRPSLAYVETFLLTWSTFCTAEQLIQLLQLR
jgi:RasGEF N-terminal motif